MTPATIVHAHGLVAIQASLRTFLPQLYPERNVCRRLPLPTTRASRCWALVGAPRGGYGATSLGEEGGLRTVGVPSATAIPVHPAAVVEVRRVALVVDRLPSDEERVGRVVRSSTLVDLTVATRGEREHASERARRRHFDEDPGGLLHAVLHREAVPSSWFKCSRSFCDSLAR